MHYNLRTQHIELTDEDKAMLDEKLERLEKLLQPPFITDISFTHDTHHHTGAVVTCRINIEHGKHVFHAERHAATAQDSLDEVIEALQQAIKKHFEKNRSW